MGQCVMWSVSRSSHLMSHESWVSDQLRIIHHLCCRVNKNEGSKHAMRVSIQTDDCNLFIINPDQVVSSISQKSRCCRLSRMSASNQFNYTDQIFLMNYTLLPVNLCKINIMGIWICVRYTCVQSPSPRARSEGLTRQTPPTRRQQHAIIGRTLGSAEHFLPEGGCYHDLQLYESINSPVRPDVCMSDVSDSRAWSNRTREKTFLKLKE